MRWLRRLILLLVVTLVLFPLSGAPTSLVNPTARADTPDDEIVLINSSGRIIVDDPRVAPNTERLTWQSPDTGWTQVALGDVNGDGDDEIIALRAGLVKVFDPVVPPGRVAASYEWAPPAGAQWLKVATGDLDRDGRAEVLLTHSLASPLAERLLVYDGNETGTAFTAMTDRTSDYGAPLRQITTGDVNGDGYADFVFIRDSSNLMHIRSGQNWAQLFEQMFTWPWTVIRLANFTSAYNGDEIAVTRNVFDPQGVRANYLLLRYVGPQPLVDVDQSYFYPPFTDIAGADINGDGDAEVVLLRDPIDPRAALVVRNPAGAGVRTPELAIGRQWRRVAAGDIDADGKDEVVVLSAGEYRIYNQLEINDNYVPVAGSFLENVLAVGNLDGQGIVRGPILSVAPAELSFAFTGPTPPPAQTLSVTNAGQGGSIAWTATVVTDTRWLRINPTSGTTPGTVSVSVDPTGLTSGQYVAGIRIDGPAGTAGSPFYVKVNLTLTAPLLSVSPLSLNFTADRGGANPASQLVLVSNAGGGGPFNWSASVITGTGWLSLSPGSGTTPSTFSVSVNIAGLRTGTYDGAIRVSAAGVPNSPLLIPVRLTVNPPRMAVTPTRVFLDIREGQQDYAPPAVSITQVGGGNAINWIAGAIPAGQWGTVSARLQKPDAGLRYTDEGLLVGDGPDAIRIVGFDWLILSPYSGTVPSLMFIRVDQDHASPGLYRATIVIDGGPDTANRFQAVDLMVFIHRTRTYIPFVAKN
jgi:hypothetical protein